MSARICIEYFFTSWSESLFGDLRVHKKKKNNND